jgi:hypothetical protein
LQIWVNKIDSSAVVFYFNFKDLDAFNCEKLKAIMWRSHADKPTFVKKNKERDQQPFYASVC